MVGVVNTDIVLEKIDHVISRLANDKSPRWDGFTNEFFKKYLFQLKETFLFLFQKVCSLGHMPQS